MSTLGTLILAFQGLSGDTAAAGADTDIISLLKDASPLSWAVLIVLLLFSAGSWGIIVHKRSQLNRAHRQTAANVARCRELGYTILEPVIGDSARRALVTALDDIGSVAFRADIAGMRHETQHTRLFRS